MPTRPLRILTHNVKMLPGLFGGGDADLMRAFLLGQAINAVSPRYDVICLQEVFDEEAREIFMKSFVRCAQVPKVSDHDIFHEDSGLYFASAFGIKGWSYVEHDDSAGNDSMSDKGVFGARLDSLSACGANVCVFQTHLQASYDSPTEHSEVRANQLDQLYRFVHASLARTTPGSTAALLVGDFNVVGDGDEYRDMLGRLPGARDLYREGHPGDAGYTFDGELNHNMIGADERTVRQRLDYVLGFDAIPASGGLPPVPLRPVRVVSRRIVAFGAVDSRLSDHFGVEAVVEV